MTTSIHAAPARPTRIRCRTQGKHPLRPLVSASVITVLVLLSVTAWAQKPSVYPAKGQDAAMQSSDDKACQAWATQDTGIDPTAVAAAPVAATGPQGERLRGAARGAVGGAVIGEIVDDDASKGASAGAAAGVIAGGSRARRNQAAQVQQAQATKTQSIDTFYRAFAACMQGRGYTVK